MSSIPDVILANGVRMPALGLGTSPMTDRTAAGAVAAAIGLGYRLIDTAEKYGNERGVGRGIRAGGVDRAELFITTKLNAEWHSVEGVRRACFNSLRRLGLDHLDLLLVHWPVPSQDRYAEAWEGLIALLARADVRAIGVSNFKPAHIDRLLEATGVAPHVNQIQLSPHLTRLPERRYHEVHGIRTMSWSPLGGEGARLLDDPVIRGIAEGHQRTPAQVVLRWHVQQGLVPVPKTTRRGRMLENIDVFDDRLAPGEMDAVSSLDGTGDPAYDSDVIGS
jgi:2,5-diketo-D-gluconate reductase A